MKGSAPNGCCCWCTATAPTSGTSAVCSRISTPTARFAAVLPRGADRGARHARLRLVRHVRRRRRAAARTPSALAELDDLLDEQCEVLGFAARDGDRRRASRRAPASRSGSRCTRSERPRPAGVLAMSPAFDARRASTSTRATSPSRCSCSTAPTIRSSRCSGRATSPASCARSASRPSTASTRWSTRSRSRACATRRAGSAMVLAGERPDEAVPDDPVELVPSVTTAQWDAEVLQERAAGDRRLLGAVVRAVPAGVADRRDDRRDAQGRLQGREGQHRRRADSSRRSTACRASR